MSEDLIRRSDAIKAIASLHILADEEKIFKVYADNPHSMTTDFEGTLIDAINAIKSIPAIDPKRGEWIEVPFNEKCKYIVCSECGNKFATDAIIPLELFTKKHKFCHNCGAEMKGADDE